MTVATGLDRLSSDSGHRVEGRHLALLTHPASVDSSLCHARTVLEAAGAHVDVLLGPEHGLGGEAQDMEGVNKGKAPRVFSLYGDTEASLRPTKEMLTSIELLVVDLQDVGTRYYTFVWTAALCLEACAALDIPVLVLDRPNPLTGAVIEGPGIAEGYRSVVGLHDVVTRHGLTIGELLTLYAKDHRLESHLSVVTMAGYRRGLWFDETGLPWVLPSPNMPVTETALVYPGLCLLEGTSVSEGRGTTRPFELIGAPWIDGEVLVAQMNAEDLPGCAFRPAQFKPMFHKYAGHLCKGLQTHVTDRKVFLPLRTGVALVRALFHLGGSEHFQWRREPYEFVRDRLAIDLLAGGTWLREGVEDGADTDGLCRGWRGQQKAFLDRRQDVLLYSE